MKHLISFSIYEEVNPKDIYEIEKNFNDYFTIAFEFELETNDRTNIITKFNNIDEDAVDDIETIVFKDMRIKKKSEKSIVSDLLYQLLDYVEYKTIDLETFEKMFDTSNFDDRKKEIVEHLKNSIKAFVYEENYTYLKRMVKNHLPEFSKKWSRKIEIVGDATLDRGIEIKPKTYVNGINESIEMINDFYNDLENQNYWTFSERTGIHINIGTSKISDWNPLKGLLLLNDFSEKNIPYTFKDMTWRLNNRFCGSLIPYLKKLNVKEKNLVKSLDIKDLNKTEEVFNKFLTKKVNDIGFKNLGFNITKLSSNYCEFRYAGGEIAKDVLIEKVKYFCFIVYAMTNKEYKKKEYIKKLYKFIDDL